MKILSLKVNEKNVSLLPIVRYKSATFNGQQCRFEPTKTKNNCRTNKTKNKGGEHMYCVQLRGFKHPLHFIKTIFNTLFISYTFK